MILRFGRAAVLAAVAGLALMVPVGASAATTVGETFVPGVGNTCNGTPDFEVMQTGRASGPSYAAPSPGVLTSWSFEAGVQSTTLTMRAFHPTGTANEYRVIADAGALQTIAPSSGLHTFGTRVPVEVGDLVGIHSQTGMCASFGAPGDTLLFHIGTVTPVGTSNTYNPNSGFIIDIAAKLEPDADGDGFGDETQDQCLGSAGPQNGCPAPAVASTPTGQRAAALKKCKKKAKKKHWSKKKLKKCEKKAKLLPV